MAEEQKIRRVEKRYFADNENRSLTMMTDLETGETKFIGRWVFIAKLVDDQGAIFEKEDPHIFAIEVEGEGKATPRVIKAFEAFDKARDKFLETMNASRPRIVGAE